MGGFADTTTQPDSFRASAVPELEDVAFVKSEYHLIIAFIQLVIRLDPDILFCWDMERGPFNYLARRCASYGISLAAALSRLAPNGFGFCPRHHLTKKDIDLSRFKYRYFQDVFPPLLEDEKAAKSYKPKGKQTGFGGKIIGRVCLNLWRVADHEFKYTSYTLCNVYAQLFGIVKPEISHEALVSSYTKPSTWFERPLIMAYIQDKISMSIQVMEHIGLIPRTIEMAKVYTVGFESVLTRGSQFKIEAHLIRVAHAGNYVLLSATTQQVANQPILQCMALNLEPPKLFLVE